MRTFIELAMPDHALETVRRRQDAVCRALDEQGVDVCFRWTQVTKVHLTLRFLGKTTDGQRQLIADGLAELSRGRSSLALDVGRLGGFPSLLRPRVLWLGLSGEIDGLNELQAAVEALVQTYGFDAESRPYSPHLTIARTKRDASRSALQRAGAVLKQFADNESQSLNEGRFSAERLVHMRSDLQRAGAVYTPLSTHALSG